MNTSDVARDGGAQNGPRSPQLRWNRPPLEGEGPLLVSRIPPVGPKAPRMRSNSSRGKRSGQSSLRLAASQGETLAVGGAPGRSAGAGDRRKVNDVPAR